MLVFDEFDLESGLECESRDAVESVLEDLSSVEVDVDGVEHNVDEVEQDEQNGEQVSGHFVHSPRHLLDLLGLEVLQGVSQARYRQFPAQRPPSSIRRHRDPVQRLAALHLLVIRNCGKQVWRLHSPNSASSSQPWKEQPISPDCEIQSE